jgi:hypothetical protein
MGIDYYINNKIILLFVIHLELNFQGPKILCDSYLIVQYRKLNKLFIYKYNQAPIRGD